MSPQISRNCNRSQVRSFREGFRRPGFTRGYFYPRGAGHHESITSRAFLRQDLELSRFAPIGCRSTPPWERCHAPRLALRAGQCFNGGGHALLNESRLPAHPGVHHPAALDTIHQQRGSRVKCGRRGALDPFVSAVLTENHGVFHLSVGGAAWSELKVTEDSEDAGDDFRISDVRACI